MSHTISTKTERSRRLHGWVSGLIILTVLMSMPLSGRARAGGTPPSGFLVNTASFGEALCPGETIVYTLGLFDTSDPSVAPYRATIADPIPTNTTFLATDGSAGLSYDPAGNRMVWMPSIDPANPADLPPTASFSVTLSSTITDGLQIVNQASGTLDTTPVAATDTSVVGCASEPPRDPADYPTPDGDEPIAPNPATPQLEPAAAPETEPYTESLVLEPESGDIAPPGFYAMNLPLVAGGAAPAALRQPTAPQDGPVLGANICDMVYPWVSRHGMSEATYQADAVARKNAGYRPIAVSANGAGSDARFAAIWIKDGRYTNNWILRHDLNGAEYQQAYEDYDAAGYIPIVVDMYGTLASPLYAAIWVRDTPPALGSHGIGAATLNQQITDRAALGYRPLWVSGLGSSGSNASAFSALWVKDAMTGTLKIDLTSDDIGTKGIARSMVNQGYHMTHLSGYTTQAGVRYAAVWTKGTTCATDRWEAFRDFSSTKYQVKASAQRPISGVKGVAAGAITLQPDDLDPSFRIGRVSLRHVSANPAELNAINPAVPGQFANGAILVIQAQYGSTINVVERSTGNLKLRSWKPSDPTIAGQSFSLNDYQYRMVLQYNAALHKWVELDRNNLSPDYYWPTSVDEYGPADARKYNSIWKAGPVDRVWRVTGTPNGADTLGEFDEAMRAGMQRLNLPNAALAIAVDGKLVLARGYSWTPSNVPAIAPNAGFRLASVSKPLTAIAVMQLIESGDLSLDWKIKDIPGFDAILQSNSWSDARIKKVTVRQLLTHTAGWDRDISLDQMTSDWTVCANQGLAALPTTFNNILAFARTQPFDHEPGAAYAYSNFGFALLGRIVEHVSGQNYNSYMQANVFVPAGANSTRLGNNVTKLPGEVTYYRPNNSMEASHLGFGAGQPASRNPCEPSHADLAPSPYGGLNIVPMAAHGGWVSTGVDLARVLVALEETTILGIEARNQMWSRPDNRGRRIAVYANASQSYKDYTLQARGAGAPVPLLASKQDMLFMGQGLTKFSSMSFTFENAGQGYAVKLYYPKRGGGFGQITGGGNALVDGTNNFAQSGKATFTAPADWEPVVISVIDPQPKFYIMAQTTVNPTAAATMDKLILNGEANYGFGYGVSESTSTLKVSNATGLLAMNNTIVGEQSKASAKILGVIGTTLILDKVSGGPFRKDEKLLVNAVTAGKAVDREWGFAADASHGGLLWGTSTTIKHYANNVDMIVLLNQDSAYGSYWYLPSDSIIDGTIDDLVKARASWPNIDLFGQYP